MDNDQSAKRQGLRPDFVPDGFRWFLDYTAGKSSPALNTLRTQLWNDNRQAWVLDDGELFSVPTQEWGRAEFWAEVLESGRTAGITLPTNEWLTPYMKVSGPLIVLDDAPAAKKTVAAETACQKKLAEIMKTRKAQTKDAIRASLMASLPDLSERAFDRAWRAALQDVTTHPSWTKPGPARTSRE